MPKHHYLSQTYLRGFTSKDGVLWGYPSTKPEMRGRVYRTSPKKAANHEKYYSVPQDWKKRPADEIENFFGQVEAAVGGFLRKAEDGDPHFTLEERHALVALAAIHYGRVPAARDHAIAQHLHLIEMSATILNSRTGSKYATSGYEITPSTDLGMMMQAINAAMTEFNEMSAKVFYFEGRDSLLTGDRPVVLHYDLDLERVRVKAARFSTPDRPYEPEQDMMAPKRLTRVIMPLNRRAMLLLDRTGVHATYPSALAAHLARSTNSLVADQCREVFAPSRQMIDRTLADLAAVDQEAKELLASKQDG